MLLVLVGIVSFLAGWFTLGVAAIRLDRASSGERHDRIAVGVLARGRKPASSERLAGRLGDSR